MSKHSITLKRDGIRGFLSSQSIGTDALNALAAIPGVKDLEIVAESDGQVELSYSWCGEDAFWGTDEQFAKFGLVRAGSK